MHRPMENNHALWIEVLCGIAVDSFAEGCLPPEAVLPGVRALDLWSDGVFGSMLFWVDAEAPQNARRQPELGDITVTRADGLWRLMGSAIATEKPWGDFLASVPPGLARCGGSASGSRDRRHMTAWHNVCLTWATAGPDVAVVRLRDHDGNVRDRRPGRNGFALLGVTPEQPLTDAYGIGHDGEQLPGEPITLRCAPYDTSSTR
jgi:hypothetical protein